MHQQWKTCLETGALSFVLATMLKNNVPDKKTMERRRSMLLQIIVRHAPQRHSSEVAWAIWASIAMKLSLRRSAVRAVLKIEDSVCALLLLHAQKLNLIDHPADLKVLKKELKAETLYGSRWLLAYEANVKGWIRFRKNKDYVAADRNFRLLKKAKVSFYDESKTVLPAQQESKDRTKAIDGYLSKITFGYGMKFENEQFNNDDDVDDDKEDVPEIF